MPTTKLNNSQLPDTLSSKTVDNTNTINTTTTNLKITGGTNGQVLSTDGSGNLSWTTAGGGGGITDGDKGDITVSASGATWTIDNDAVTYAKIQNVTTNRLLGRVSSGSGDTEEITIGSGLTVTGTTLSAGSQVQVDVITSSQNWTMPSWAKKVTVYLLGGGGGGGSGRRDTTTNARGGGGGGGASGYLSAVYQASAISSPVSVTIGAGGTGGAARAPDGLNPNQSGAAGDPGGNTIFGSLLRTTNSGGGGGGGVGGNSNGGIITQTNSTWFVNSSTQNGFQGRAQAGEGSTTAINITTMLGGGGGAGAAASSTTTANGGTVAPSNLSTMFPSWTFGTAGTNGGNGGNGANFDFGILKFGTSGGGGSYKTGQNTGAGGNGGYGAGGGGGAASDTNNTSGKGGDGGSGLCIILTEG